MKKKIYALLGIVASVSVLFAGCNSATDTTKDVKNKTKLETVDYVANMFETDKALEAEAEHTLEEAQVIKDPYGVSPLTAVICFSTEEKTGGKITVCGKNKKDNVVGTIVEDTKHVVPVYGLYNGAKTTVKIELDNGQKKDFEIETEKCNVTFDIKADKIDTKSYDYNHLTMAMSAFGMLYAFDSEGDVRWYYTDSGVFGVKQLENGHLIVPTTYVLKPQYYASGLKEIDFLGKVYNEYAIPGGQHHGIYVMEDNNLLVASDANDLSTVEDNVKLIDYKTGKVKWECDMNKLIPDMKSNSASIITDGSEELDWCHNNGVAYDEENNLVLLSCRHLDAIVAVKMEEEPSLAWILGNPDEWGEEYSKYFFKPEGDDFEWFYAQHNVSLLDNGDVMLFDNGTAKVKRSKNDDRVTGNDVYSRAVAYHIDTEKMTVSQTWQYGKERGGEWYSDWISGATSVTGDTSDVWVTSGSNLYLNDSKSYDGNPLKMFAPNVDFTTNISHVVDNRLAYEFKVTGKDASALTFRSIKINMYAGNYAEDQKTNGTFLGKLGKKEPEKDRKIELNDAQKMPQDTVVSLDPTKLTVTASYTLDEYDEKTTKLAGSYIVLVDADGTQKVYALTENATQNTDKDGNPTAGASVAVTGYITPDELEEKYDVYLVIGGTVYNTEYYVDFGAK